ncbi:MAG: hypothetical protein ABIP95_13900 [Pelobium sp.]
MKKSILFILPIAFALFSCNQNSKTATESNTNDSLGGEVQCYSAVNGADSATLKTSKKNGRIVGELAFNFSKKDDTQGTISGEFKGDTLFLEYSFIYKGTEYNNPQVFLKKGAKLLQGSGELETMLGRTYFKKDVPINFEEGFAFEPSNCK